MTKPVRSLPRPGEPPLVFIARTAHEFVEANGAPPKSVTLPPRVFYRLLRDCGMPENPAMSGVEIAVSDCGIITLLLAADQA